MSRRRPSVRRTLGLSAVSALLLFAACGGGEDTSDGAGADTASDVTSDPAAAAVTDTVAATPESAAPDTAPVDTSVGEIATFDGPSFVDLIDEALAPYAGLVGQSLAPGTVASALPGLPADAPIMPGLTIVSAARTLEEWGADTIDDVQLVGAEGVVGGLAAFGASVSAPWSQTSFATSGSLSTLLLTDGGAGRVAYVEESDPAGSFRAPVEMRAELRAGEIIAPSWVAALPVLDGGRIVEVTEAHGLSSENLFGGSDYVLVRVRYPADQIEALNAFLESGVVEAAGFTYDKDMFNGFENLVDVTIGEWTGSVLIGSGSMGDEEFYDLVWSLGR